MLVRCSSKFILILLIFLFLFAKPLWAVETKVSYKKGVGLTIPATYCFHKPEPEVCQERFKNTLSSLGITWFYNWTKNNIFPIFGDAFEFVPMIRDAGANSDRSYTQQQLDDFANTARNHPGSYWLIWNEPDFDMNQDGQPDIPVEDAARIYKPLRDAIKGTDPTAKLIIGGMAYYDYWSSWASGFRTNYRNIYGEDPQYEGWHGHMYVCYDENYDSMRWRSKITSFRNWIDSHGGGEFWLTEFGCLNYWPNVSKIITDQLDWMETYSGIQRYAWFSAGPSDYQGNLLSGYPDSSSFGLSALGQTYAQYPHHPNPTHTPTPTPAFLLGLTRGWNYLYWQPEFPSNIYYSSLPDSCSLLTQTLNNFWWSFRKIYSAGSNAFIQDRKYSISCLQTEQWGF